MKLRPHKHRILGPQRPHKHRILGPRRPHKHRTLGPPPHNSRHISNAGLADV